MAVVPLRTAADSNGRVAEVLIEMEAAGRVMPILRSVANAESAFAPFLRYSGALVRSLELPARTRELVIMRAAARLRSRYEWAEHVEFALEAGVTGTELEQLSAGTLPESLDDDERLVLGAVDGLLETLDSPSASPPGELARIRELLGPRQYAELALVLGWWCGCVPILVAVLGLEEDVPDDIGS